MTSNIGIINAKSFRGGGGILEVKSQIPGMSIYRIFINERKILMRLIMDFPVENKIFDI